jgi:uridine kinase
MRTPPPIPYIALAARLHTLDPSCGPVRIVAVDGPSGAGKSTFAARLSPVLGGAPVVHSDDFPVPWDGDPLAWWPPLAVQVLEPLRKGRPGHFRRYDWRRGIYTEDIEVPLAPVLIIEGVGAAVRTAPAAYRVWVDAPHGVRRRRAIERGDDVAAWDRWAEAERRQFAADGTRDRADLVVDGTDDLHRAS